MAIKPCRDREQDMMNYVLTGNLPGWLRSHILGCSECAIFENSCHSLAADTNQEVERIFKKGPQKGKMELFIDFILPLLFILIILMVWLLGVYFSENNPL